MLKSRTESQLKSQSSVNRVCLVSKRVHCRAHEGPSAPPSPPEITKSYSLTLNEFQVLAASL